MQPQTIYERLEKLFNNLCDLINQPNLKTLFEKKEEQVKISLILPLLQMLDWNIHNPLEVQFESSTQEGGRMDIVLFSSKENTSKQPFKPLKDGDSCKFLIEVKNLSQDLKKHIDQLGRYIYSQGIPYGAITNGKVWIFMEAFTPGKPFNERKLVEVDICEDNPLKVVPIFICLSKENISLFKECLKEKIQKIKHYLSRIKENGFKPGKCPKKDLLERYICKKVSEKIEECLNELENSLKVSVLLEPKESFQKSYYEKTSKNVSKSEERYAVILGGENITAPSRVKLIEKIFEKAFREGWIKEKDFPLFLDNHLFASLANRTENLSEKHPGVKILEVNGLKIYIKIGTSGPSQKTKIGKLIEFLSKKVPGKFEIIRI